MSNYTLIANKIRIGIISMISHLGYGHVGGSLSIADVLSVLYFGIMNIDPSNPKMENRDRFVLSKGHTGPALYSTLAIRGYFPMEHCLTLNQPNTNFPSHCNRLRTPGIDMTTGSLGQGISPAIGMALALKCKNNPANVFVILGDGELQEGQIWEAAMYAGNKNLDNLIAFIDKNELQIDGRVSDVNSIDPLADKWTAFNWEVFEVDGHDCNAIYETIIKAKEVKNKPSMIILHTVKGKGVAFAEGLVSSHSMAVTKEMADEAIAKLRGEVQNA